MSAIRQGRDRRAGSRAALLLAIGAVVAGAALVVAQAPPFRTVTDLIVIDMEVVDNKGLPIPGLGPDKFEVSIGGSRRRVVKAELVRYDAGRIGMTPRSDKPAPSVAATNTEPAGRASGAAPASMPPRVFVLAVDTRSFAPGSSRGVLAAAQGFIERLSPTDVVGVLSYPAGPQVDLTTDRAAVLAALGATVGQRQLPVTRFTLRPSEIITLSRKIEALENYTAAQIVKEVDLQPILSMICPAEGGRFLDREECFRTLAAEVRGLVIHFEQEASDSLRTLRSLLERLGQIEGRKTLVLVSGGLIVADQVSSRPSVGNMAVVMSQEAARANTAIYTLFVDWKFLEQFSASSATLSGTTQNLARDASVNSQWLDEFSTTAGGKLFTVSAGGGEFAFTRILSETSAHYVLGVEPEPPDRDGRPHRLDVKVKQRGATIRARTWIVMPDERVQLASVRPIESPVAPPVAESRPTPAPVSSAAPPVSAAPARPAATSVAAPAEPAARGLALSATRAVSGIDAALPGLLGSTGSYVTRFDSSFANVVSEERYVQDATPGNDGAPVVRHRELRSDFLLVTVAGDSGWTPFRDVFEVNGSPIRDREERLMKLFLKPDPSALAQAKAILDRSASYNIGIQRTVNLPVVGLNVFRASNQNRFRFSGGSLDPSAESAARVVAFSEQALPSMITSSDGRSLMMTGQAWIDMATGAVLRTELLIDDTTMRVTIVTRYQFNPQFNIAIPVEMQEEYNENNGRQTRGSATYGRFRRFDVATSDDLGKR